jgi:phosphoribosylanthranilate isomerase
MRDVVQVAGILDRAEAEMLVEAGVELLGFPLRLLDGREDLSERAARAIVESLPDPASAVCITYVSGPREIVELCDAVGMRRVQLHAPVPVSALAELRECRPGLFVIKSLIVRGADPSALEAELDACAPFVDAFITDTFDPATGRTGATGRTHDWSVSRRLVEASPRPVILAGGLTPDNVSESIRRTAPAGVDAHTGLEGPDGRKSPERIARFLAEARAGFEAVARGTRE